MKDITEFCRIISMGGGDVMGYFDDELYMYNNQNSDYTDVALICENGQIINDCMKEYPEYNSAHCEKCGAKAISNCPHCNKSIDGKRHIDGFIGCSEIDLPSYCKHCGKPFPWTESKLNALNEIVDLMDQLSSDEKQELKESAIIISNDSPRTQVGVLKVKKYLAKVGKSMGEVAQKVFVDVASETAIKMMKEQKMI